MFSHINKSIRAKRSPTGLNPSFPLHRPRSSSPLIRGLIVMADSSVSCTTPINIPLERSLYVGNMFSGILLGETSKLQQSHLTHESRTQDWIFSHSSPLYIASPIVPLITAKAKHSTLSMAGSCLHLPLSAWRRTLCGANTCGLTTATILVARSDTLHRQKPHGTMSLDWWPAHW
jgi:hypothetical protein